MLQVHQSPKALLSSASQLYTNQSLLQMEAKTRLSWKVVSVRLKSSTVGILLGLQYIYTVELDRA
jgi:hypothetical protein